MPPLGEIRSGTQAIDQWENARRQPQSLATYEQAITLTNPRPTLARTYILLAQKIVDDPFVRYARQAESDPAWQFRAFPGDHMAMLTQPEALTALLLEVA